MALFGERRSNLPADPNRPITRAEAQDVVDHFGIDPDDPEEMAERIIGHRLDSRGYRLLPYHECPQCRSYSYFLRVIRPGEAMLHCTRCEYRRPPEELPYVDAEEP